MINLRFSIAALVSGICLSQMPVSGTVVLQDTFSNGNPTTGAEVHANPSGNWNTSGGTITETNGSLTVSTSANSTQYSQSSIFTQVLPQFNIFSQTVKISVTGFSQSGTGVNATTGQNFRLGLMPTDTSPANNTASEMHTGILGSFYNQGNDGINLRITNNRAYSIQFKHNALGLADPATLATANPGSSANQTLSFNIVGFDLEFTSSTWMATFYGSGGETSVNSGTWNLPSDPETGEWGTAANGWGNASLMMYSQNGAVGVGNTSFSMGSITAEAIPEPGRMALLFGASAFVLFRRRR